MIAEIAECTYQIVGATDGSLNGNYRNTGTSCELFRNVYKHENKEAYLYFIWSPSRFEYFWLVNSVSCVDSVYSGAYLQVDDYSAYPELIFQTWEELIPNGGYQPNSNIDVDCLSKYRQIIIYLSNINMFIHIYKFISTIITIYCLIMA